MKPIIGVVLRPVKSEEGYEMMGLYDEIGAAILKNGGIPLGLYPPQIESYYGKKIAETKSLTYKEWEKLKETINFCDGIICQGGDDYYDYDLKIIQYAHQIDKPLMGICLGMQAMAMAFGGQMEKINNLDHCQKGIKEVHEVNILKSSYLYSLLKKEKVMVNSRHRWQVVKTDLEVVGLASDNVIEAIEDSSKKFFIGLEWHPESMLDNKLMNSLFKSFILACYK